MKNDSRQKMKCVAITPVEATKSNVLNVKIPEREAKKKLKRVRGRGGGLQPEGRRSRPKPMVIFVSRWLSLAELSWRSYWRMSARFTDNINSATCSEITRSLAIATRPCDCCIILKSGSYTKAMVLIGLFQSNRERRLTFRCVIIEKWMYVYRAGASR